MYGHISHPVVIIRSIRIVARSALEIVSISVCFMRFKRGRDVGTRRARFGGIVHVHPCVQQVYTELCRHTPDCGHRVINQSNRSCGIKNRVRFRGLYMVCTQSIYGLYTLHCACHGIMACLVWYRSGLVMRLLCAFFAWYCVCFAFALLVSCLVLPFAPEHELGARPEAKGYKEQERGQEALVSLWCMLGIALRAFFALRLAHARMVAG